MERDEAEQMWADLRAALDDQNAFAEASGSDGPRAGAWTVNDTVRLVIHDIDVHLEETGSAVATLSRAEALALAHSLTAAAQE